MSKRTLSDELQSVLLAHSFDAPDADDTIARTLAETVDQARIQKLTRRRWRPSVGLVSGAAAAVVVVAVGAGIVKLGQDDTGSAKSSSGQANTAALPAAGAEQHQESTADGFGLKAPPLRGSTAGSQASSASTFNPLGDNGIPRNLSCAAAPGTKGIYTENAPLAAGERVISAQCTDGLGDRASSQVYVVGHAGEGHTLNTTVIAQSDGVSVDTVSSGSGGITVRFLRLASGSAPEALQEATYQSSDGGKSFDVTSLRTLASVCSVSALRASVTPGATGSAVLQVRNVSPSVCVISGYPTVSGGSKSLRGSAGGTSAALVPIVLLQPGDVASASIEQPTRSVPCPSVQPSVGLPDGEELNPVNHSADISCQARVHPFVAGSSGTG